MGKSTVADAFAGKGIHVVDTDIIARELTAPNGKAMPLIRERFGQSAASPDGSMNRTWMRRHVFGDAKARATLEGILHPMIRDESLARLTLAKSPYAMLVVPLLIETGIWRSLCDCLLVIDCPEETQIQRVMARNNLSRKEVLDIISTQASRHERLAAATDIIDNGSTPEKLVPEVEKLHQRYLQLASAGPKDKS